MNPKNMMRSFLIAAVVVPALALAQEPSSTHDAVVIVLDDSGSMKEGMGGPNKMDAAKQALRTVLQGIPATTWIGLLAINAGWAYELGPRNDVRLHAAIGTISADGRTPLARNIKDGADRLMAERAKQLGYGNYRLLVVTDGAETENARTIETYPPEVRARGLTLDVIGVAMDVGHVLAKYAHTYRNASDPASLEHAIREVLAERVDPNDRTGGGDAFELIAGLDPGVAAAALAALGKTENHPIGTEPPASKTESGSGGGAASGASGVSDSKFGGPNCGGCQSASSGSRGAARAALGLLLLITAMVWLWPRTSRARRNR